MKRDRFYRKNPNTTMKKYSLNIIFIAIKSEKKTKFLPIRLIILLTVFKWFIFDNILKTDLSNFEFL